MRIIIISMLLFVVSSKPQVDNKSPSKENNISEDLPLWVKNIYSNDNLDIKQILDLSPSFQLVDINGDSIKECIILTKEGMYVFYRVQEKVAKILMVFSIGVFDEDENINLSKNISWIRDWNVVHNESIKERMVEMDINDIISGDGIDLVAPDGKVTMYFDGKNFKWLFYD